MLSRPSRHHHQPSHITIRDNMVNWVLNGSGELIIISENTIKRTTQGAATVTVSTLVQGRRWSNISRRSKAETGERKNECGVERNMFPR